MSGRFGSIRRLALPIVVMAMAAASPPSRGDATADARKAIETCYGKISTAVTKGDAKAYVAAHTTDYTETGKAGNKQTIAEVSKGLPMISQFVQNLKHKVTIQSLKLNGKTATVSATEQMDGSMKNPQTNKASTIHAERTLTDTWVQNSGKWLRKSTKELSVKYSVDGKPQG